MNFFTKYFKESLNVFDFRKGMGLSIIDNTIYNLLRVTEKRRKHRRNSYELKELINLV